MFYGVYKNIAGEKKSKDFDGPIPPAEYAGQKGAARPIMDCRDLNMHSFDAAYPFAIVNLDDDDMPVSAKAKIFNPFIPGDAISSGIPIAVIRYEIKNKTNQPLTVAVAGSLDNFIGMDGSVAEFNSFDRVC